MVGLAIQLVQTWSREVCRRMLALCWSIITEVHMMTHDEVDTDVAMGMKLGWRDQPSMVKQHVEL